MVQADVPLVRIGQVLRHRSLQSTAIYARVDVEQLRLLARAVAGRCAAMSGLQAHVDEYLRLRRALGFKLEEDGRTARSACRLPRGRRREHGHAASSRSPGRGCLSGCTRTTGRSGCGSRGGSPPTCKRSTRATEIPPPDVFPVRRQRATPYLFSQEDICRLLAEARRLRHPLRAASYEALFGLLAVIRHADRRGDRARARGRRPRRRPDHDPQSESTTAPGSCRCTPDRHRSVAPLRVRARPAVPKAALARVLSLQRRHPRPRG